MRIMRMWGGAPTRGPARQAGHQGWCPPGCALERLNRSTVS
jgi:hypothetical protein